MYIAIIVLAILCNILMAWNIILRIKLTNPGASGPSFLSMYTLRSFSVFYLFPAFAKKEYSDAQRTQVKRINRILLVFYVLFILFAILVYNSVEGSR